MDTQETNIFTAIIITVIVLGIIIGYFVISMIRQQKRNLALQKAQVLAEISAMESERTRIAADLHDELGPLLSVIKFQVDYGSQNGEQGIVELNKASEQLDSLIGRMREIANNLMPSALHRKGLVTAIEEFISKIESTGRLKITFEHPDETGLSAGTSIQVYRMLQEIIHNCLKHAEASHMLIRIENEKNLVKIFCRDDGKGFNYEEAKGGVAGLGLSSLRNRTMMLGGRLRAESKPGLGTAYLIILPVQ